MYVSRQLERGDLLYGSFADFIYIVLNWLMILPTKGMNATHAEGAMSDTYRDI